MIESWMSKAFSNVRELLPWPGDNCKFDKNNSYKDIEKILRVILWKVQDDEASSIKSIRPMQQMAKARGMLALYCGGAACGDLACACYALLTQRIPKDPRYKDLTVFVIASEKHTICCVEGESTGKPGKNGAKKGWFLDTWYLEIDKFLSYEAVGTNDTVSDTLVADLINYNEGSYHVVDKGSYGATDKPLSLTKENVDKVEIAKGRTFDKFLKRAKILQESVEAFDAADLLSGFAFKWTPLKKDETGGREKLDKQTMKLLAQQKKLNSVLDEIKHCAFDDHVIVGLEETVGTILAFCQLLKIDVEDIAKKMISNRLGSVRDALAEMEKI